MANPVGYDVVFSPHPKTWFEDGYVGFGSDGYTPTTYTSGIVTASLAPNTLLKSITHTGTGTYKFTFKETWPLILFASVETVCPSGSSPVSLRAQVLGSTVGTSTATVPVVPSVTVLVVDSTGTASDMVANGGLFYHFILQLSDAYK